MRSFRVIVMSLVIGVTLAHGQINRLKADRESTTERTLLERERQICEAYKERNEETLREALAEDFIFSDETGQLYNKEQYLDAALKAIRVKSYELKNTTIRLYGDTAIVTAEWAGEFTIEGKDASGIFRFTDTFVKRNGRWFQIASQDTRLPR